MNIRNAMGFVLIAVSGMAAPAVAQDSPVQKEEVRHGDRVTVLLDNGEAFTGMLIHMDGDSILLDTTYETSGYYSCVGFQLRRVKKIQKETPRTLEELKRIGEHKKDEQKRMEGEHQRVKESEAREEREAAERAKKAKEEAQKAAQETEEAKKKEKDETLLKGIDLLKEFPPSGGWSQAKYDQLKDQFNVKGVALTDAEKNFLENYESWKAAKDALEAAAAGEVSPAAPPVTKSREPEPIIEDLSPKPPQ